REGEKSARDATLKRTEGSLDLHSAEPSDADHVWCDGYGDAGAGLGDGGERTYITRCVACWRRDGQLFSRLLRPAVGIPKGRRLACMGEIILLDGVGTREYVESLGSFVYPMPKIW
ncbi:unnamed protein product, partial [Pylaiella littoralis]